MKRGGNGGIAPRTRWR